MPLFFVNCEGTVLFSVKRDLDPPFTTLNHISEISRLMLQTGKHLEDPNYNPR